ncbi:hypothetical protein [Streptomyces sp. NPDC005046]
MGESFRVEWRIVDLIRQSRTCGAPDPGIICPDDGPEFTALQIQVRAALQLEPRKLSDLARDRDHAQCNGCAAQHSPTV